MSGRVSTIGRGPYRGIYPALIPRDPTERRAQNFRSAPERGHCKTMGRRWLVSNGEHLHLRAMSINVRLPDELARRVEAVAVERERASRLLPSIFLTPHSASLNTSQCPAERAAILRLLLLAPRVSQGARQTLTNYSQTASGATQCFWSTPARSSPRLIGTTPTIKLAGHCWKRTRGRLSRVPWSSLRRATSLTAN